MLPIKKSTYRMKRSLVTWYFPSQLISQPMPTYFTFQKFQTWPVLSSESKCRIAVDHKIYKSVNCRERHLFEPFSGKQSGAMTTVVQDLVLIEEKNKTDNQIMEEQPKSK